MAISSGTYKNISIALIISASLTGYAIAASTKTQPSTNVYDVKEKDLPKAETLPPASDIPPPDFKDFQDDKYINKLLGDDNKTGAKAETKTDTANKDTAPPAPDAKPDVIIDKMLGGDEQAAVQKKDAAQPAHDVLQTPKADTSKTDTVSPAVPASAETKASPPHDAVTPKTEEPTPAAAAIPAPVEPAALATPGTTVTDTPTVQPENSQTIVTAPLSPEEEADQELNSKPAVPSTTSPATSQADVKQDPGTETPTKQEATPQKEAEQQKPDILTEEQKQTYAELKKHLTSFVTNFQASVATEKAKVAENEPKAPETKNAAPDPIAPSPATEEVKTATAGTTKNTQPIADATKSPAEPAPLENKPAAEKQPATDELSELLDPVAKTAHPAPQADKKPDVATTNAPSTPTEVATAPAEVTVTPTPPVTAAAITNTAPITTPVSKETPPAANNLKAAPVPVAVETKTTPGEQEKTIDTVEELKAQEPLPQEAPETKTQSVVREKPSEADKAYFKLLDKKREKLPESQRLSNATRETMDELSTALAPVKKTGKKTPQSVNIEHGNIGEPGFEENGVTKSKSTINVSVRKMGSEGYEEKTKVKLEKAYKALLVGQIAAAINIYKEILDKEPNNMDAMFGLATAYHKNSQFEQARAIYTDILKNEPSNKEALNNFLVLVAEEAPEDALLELEKLERINSDFSPIPAQIAMINLKLGNPEKAARYLRRAILLSPENISYKYNLAITYDKLGKDEQAVQLYHQIINDVHGGAIISGSIDKVIERTTYLEKKINSAQ